jgi:hypothetical protein
MAYLRRRSAQFQCRQTGPGETHKEAEFGMDRDGLAQVLTDAGHAATACRSALHEGAELILWKGRVPADRMVPAYERRQARALADGVRTIGFPEALDGLRRAGHQELRLGQVTVVDPPYVFMLFLTGDPTALVACVGIDQHVVGPER